MAYGFLVTIAVGPESKNAEFPFESAAVSRTRIVWSSSAFLTVYVRPQAPVMPVHEAPPALQRSQSYVGIAPAGVQAPREAVSSESGLGSPEIVGACVTVAANADVATSQTSTSVMPAMPRQERLRSDDSAMSCVSSGIAI
jgi:hypothetical protein